MKRENHSELKAKVRASKAWKDLREVVRKNQNGKDFLTEKKLTKTAAVHHMDLDSANYGDFSDLSHFVFLNNKTHEHVHFLYEIYKKDPTVMDRLNYLMQKMAEINSNQSFR